MLTPRAPSPSAVTWPADTTPTSPLPIVTAFTAYAADPSAWTRPVEDTDAVDRAWLSGLFTTESSPDAPVPLAAADPSISISACPVPSLRAYTPEAPLPSTEMLPVPV